MWIWMALARATERETNRLASRATVGPLMSVAAAALGLGCNTGSPPGEPSSFVDTSAVTDVAEPEALPECVDDADCAALFTDLLPCEVGVCDAGTCARQITEDPFGCDDESPCSVDSCNADGTCAHVAVESDACCDADVDCDDGNPCTQGVCSSGGSCKYAAVEGSCDDGNPCTDADACVFGTCQGEDTGGCRLACLLTGAAGEVVTCDLGLARLGEGSAPAVALQMELQFDGAAAKLVALVDTVCFDGTTCTEQSIPTASTSLKPSGHNVALDPAARSPSTWPISPRPTL